MTVEAEGTTSAPEAGVDTAIVPVAAVLEEAERLFGAGQTDEAASHLEAARRCYHDAGDASSEGAVLRGLANLQFSLGNTREAERQLELACERYTQVQQTATAADLYLSVGDLRTKAGESKRAREAYLSSAKLFRSLDDPLGQAHAEFKLGSLHATTNYDMALRHYNFAASLYEAADGRLPPDDSLRLDNPHLPENFEDCRQIVPWIMARVARREADRLRTEIGPMVENKPAVTAAPSGGFARGLIVFLIVPAVFIGAVFAITQAPAIPFTFTQSLLLPIALLAGGLSVVLARMNGVESPAVQWVGAIIVVVGVQIANAALTKDFAVKPIEEDGVRAEMAKSLAGLSVAKDAPAGVAGERAELTRTLIVARERGDRVGEAVALQAQANFERRAGSPAAQVTVLYASALDIYRELNDKPRQLEILVPLGEMHALAKQYAQAREAYTQAAELYAQQADTVNQAKVLVFVGDAERELQRPKQARAAYARAVELAHQKDPVAEAQALLRLGKLDAEHHSTERARKAYREALALSEQRNDTAGQAEALRHLGELEAEARKYQEAIALYDRALTLYGTDDLHVGGRIRVLKLRGDLERARKDAAAARTYYTQALALSEEKAGGAQAAEILMAIADATASMGENDQARDTYMRALGRYEQGNNVEGQISTLRRLSQLAAKSNLALAQQYAKRAATLQETVGNATSN